ncbi:MAG: threonylcarbamoyl-AMP synthase [Flammeovirgaceae bacterium]|nr:threonylcarbamoyl-AMP synthase [Flammeovirgaceae bacterium]
MADFIKINPDNPQENKIRQVVEVLKSGGLVIYPTDTIYAIGCDIYNTKAISRLCRLKGVKPDKLDFSFICYDLSEISNYAKRISNLVFKLMKKTLPGPFTYILGASSNVPKIFGIKKKQVGIRVPNNNIPREIVKELGNPILTTSIRDEDEIVEYFTDPELILEKYNNLVEAVVDGGYGNNVPSTILNCTNDNIEIIRQGLGEIDEFL